jgi:hypothetical protein
MTILQQPPLRGDGHAGQAGYRLGHADGGVRHTAAWRHAHTKTHGGALRC